MTSDEILIPSIPELTYRRIAGRADYASISTLYQRSMDADGIDEAFTADDVTQIFSFPHNFNPKEDARLAEVAGECVGFVRVNWEKEDIGARIYRHFGCVVPQWRRRGIGGSLLGWAQRRILAIAATQPQDGPRFFQAFAAENAVGTRSMLEKDGYSPERYFDFMIRCSLEDIPDLPLPAGLEIRPATPAHYRAIWDAMNEAFQDHWGSHPPSEENYQHWQHHRLFQPNLWKVAWDGDQVAGMSVNSIDQEENRQFNRERGYIEDLGVRRPWRRRGLASALLALSLEELALQGMKEASLGVDTRNPSGALRLYERLGFRRARREIAYQKPFPGQEIPDSPASRRPNSAGALT